VQWLFSFIDHKQACLQVTYWCGCPTGNRRNRLQYKPSSAAPEPSGLHPNDILANIQLSPYTPPKTDAAGSSTSELRSPSMYDLLQELQSLTNAHHKDWQLFTLYVLCFGCLSEHLTTFNPSIPIYPSTIIAIRRISSQSAPNGNRGGNQSSLRM